MHQATPVSHRDLSFSESLAQLQPPCCSALQQQSHTCACFSDAAEWLRTTDEVLSSWKNITNLEAGTTYELRVVATNGGVTRASHIEEVTTDGIGRAAEVVLRVQRVVC